MRDLNGANSNPKDIFISKNYAEANSKSFPLLGKLDGNTIIQAVVMTELLGKPKAKRRKRGHFSYEGTHSR